MVAIERRRDPLVQSRIRQQISSQLLDRELVERHVAVERIDDPVAPPPHVSLAVGLVAIAVRVSRSLEPGKSHSLPVARRPQQPIDDLVVSVRRSVPDERVDLGEAGWQADEIKRNATNPRRSVSVRRRPQALSLEPFQHEGVNWIAYPPVILHPRKVGTSRRHERPVLLPARPLLDPPPNDRNVPGAERLAPLRHPTCRTGRGNAADHLAPRRVTRHNGKTFFTQSPLGPLFTIEAQTGHLLRRTVTGVALVREDRPNIAIEFDGLGNGAFRCGLERMRAGHQRDADKPESHHQPPTSVSRSPSPTSHRSPPRRPRCKT